MKPFANYDKDGHLTKLHLFPSEECNTDQATGKKIKTRKQMLEAILFVTKLKQLCDLEYPE